MQYGLTFIVDMHDFERGEELHVLTLPGDYIRMRKWAEEHMPGADEDDMVVTLRRNYAIAWHALKRRGKLEEHGLPEELDLEAVDAMADRFSVYLNEVDQSNLPLPQEPPR